MAKGSRVASAILASGSNPQLQSALSPLLSGAPQGQFDVNRPYTQLPRPASVFTQGDFGPLAPIQPMPIDVPGDSGRPDPRRAEYEMGWNLPVGQPGSEGIKLTDFNTLRAAADRYSVVRACIDHRVNEIVSMGWDVVPTAEATQAMKGDPDLREDWEKRRRQVIGFFKSPDSDKAKYPTFGSWLGALLEERFTLDAVAIHMRPPRGKGSGPFGSNLAALDLLDGSTVRPLLDLYGSTPAPPNVAYQQYIWGVPRSDLISVITEQDVAGLGEPAVDFKSDQLIYMRETPRTWTPYGFSAVEKSLVPITMGFYRQTWQLDYFADGSVPAQFITPGPDISTPQQIRQLQDALNAMAGDVGAKHRIIVLPPGSKSDPQKPVALADQFDEWVISQVTMNFGMTPMDVGVTPRVSAVQSPSESKQLSQINTDKGSANRIQPVITQLKADLLDFVIQSVFGQSDMEWSWGVTSSGDRETDEINNHIALVTAGIETRDEARVAMGKTPFGLDETSVPTVTMATGVVPLTLAVAQAQQALTGTLGQQQPGEQSATPDASVPSAQGGATPTAPPPKVDLTTPAHEAAIRAATSGTGPDPATKSITAELEILERYLKKGRPIARFRSEVIPGEVLEAAEAELPKA